MTEHGINPVNISFTPSPDVSVVLGALLDILERRTSQSARQPAEHGAGPARGIKVELAELVLPAYFSQIDPMPRLTANEQFQALEQAGLLKLAWIPGETGHLLKTVALDTEHAHHLYQLIDRTALAARRSRLESLLLGEKFRFPEGDWRQRAIRFVLQQLKSGKSASPFNLADWGLNLDLLNILAMLPTLSAETPYRVFSVRIFNDSKRLEALKNQLVTLARLGNPEWKQLPAEEVLRELNLVPNPNYIHLAGNWQLGLESGEILSLGGFVPSAGFPAAQTVSLRNVTVHADVIICIENLTTFHEFIRAQTGRYAVLCTYGNPSPAVRRILRLVPEETPIFHWSDLDYGGFNILSQLRRLVSARVTPYRMDIATLDANFERSRPLTVADRANLKKLLIRPELRDVRPVIEHLLKRGLKLEQEGVEI
jgi:hypothetical protein